MPRLTALELEGPGCGDLSEMDVMERWEDTDAERESRVWVKCSENILLLLIGKSIQTHEEGYRLYENGRRKKNSKPKWTYPDGSTPRRVRHGPHERWNAKVKTQVITWLSQLVLLVLFWYPTTTYSIIHQCMPSTRIHGFEYLAFLHKVMGQ